MTFTDTQTGILSSIHAKCVSEFWRQRVVTQTCFCQLERWPKKWEDFAWLLSTQYITDRFLITVASYLVCQNTKRGKLLHNSIHVLSVEIMCKMHKRQHDWSEHFCFKIYCLDLRQLYSTSEHLKIATSVCIRTTDSSQRRASCKWTQN